ncbi:hypothetical protein PAESOLCIP111_03358 [Paenibacillus solanacearum]|uniref:Uncharacterized protein n=1 Tax=Paenibacillus solanacearum TaxID=2048548 RepID=A0A916K5X6_9BACL|nr:hypothetical protein PAESOLCIP111_03358 [Paenibacillus solanacearum]
MSIIGWDIAGGAAVIVREDALFPGKPCGRLLYLLSGTAPYYSKE